jgi:hypothetical protein
MPALFLLLILASTLWAGIDVAAQPTTPICDRINDEGILSLKAADHLAVQAVCQCEAEIIRFSKSTALQLYPCYSAMKQVRELSIEKSRMTQFPMEILEMDALEILSFAFTPIAHLPDDIWKLRNLKLLNLKGTKVNSLPDGLDFVELIDMRMIEFTKAEQDAIRAQYPQSAIYFSAPCKCY